MKSKGKKVNQTTQFKGIEQNTKLNELIEKIMSRQIQIENQMHAVE